MKNTKKAFSIIEVLIWIFIFSMWLMSVYMLLQSSININKDNKDRIIASNLAREGIELVRNIRDSNYKTTHIWNTINPKITTDLSSDSNLIETWVYYKVYNNFNWNIWDFPVKMRKIQDFWEWVDFLSKMESYRLCLDAKNRYTYDCNWNKKTMFYRYIRFDDIDYTDSWEAKHMTDSYKVTSKVFWYDAWLHSTDIKTIITDYKKL